MSDVEKSAETECSSHFHAVMEEEETCPLCHLEKARACLESEIGERPGEASRAEMRAEAAIAALHKNMEEYLTPGSGWCDFHKLYKAISQNNNSNKERR